MANLITPDFDAIPEFLRQEKLWGAWPAEPNSKGGISKRPVGTSGYPVATNKTQGWDSFDNARSFYESNKGKILPDMNGPISGVGLCLLSSSSLVVIDLDHAINPDGTIAQWAEPIINELAEITYCEISPSGTGIHAWLYGKKRGAKCKGGPGNNLEIYDNRRFMTVTGYKLDGCQDTAASGEMAQAMIDRVISYIEMSKKKISTGERDGVTPLQEEIKSLVPKNRPEAFSDSELVAKARQSRKGKEFSLLYDSGDISGYPSASEADQGLCNKLAFWTGRDAARMDRLMRQSALLNGRPERLAKWDRKTGDSTYGEMTISKAIQDCPKCFGDVNSTRDKKRSYTAIPDNGKPKIVYRPGELPRLVKEIDASIRGRAWRFGELLVGIARLPETRSYRGLKQAKGASLISPYDVHSLSLLASNCASWVRISSSKEGDTEIPINPPAEVMQIFLAAKAEWTLPPLTGLVNCPVIRPDGSLLYKPGWDSETGLYADFDTSDFPYVATNPDKEAAFAAWAVLKDAISEFPFKTDVDQSVALAAMLTAVLRPSVKSSPMFAFSAPTPGTGKSALADLVGIMATGKPCAAMDFNKDESEFKKAIIATLLEGSPVTLIDNVVGELNNSLLNSALSQETISGRILGLSKTVKLSTTTLWLATGNNLTICGDLTRRTLLCNLDAETERPAERTFRRDIYQWGTDHRGEMTQAALTILRAYFVAGRPVPDGIKPMNGFNDWSRWVRGALLWLGEADPKESQFEIEAHDPEREGLLSVLQAWHEHFGSAFVTTKDLLSNNPPEGELQIPDSQVALYQALLEAIPHGRELTGRLLGKWLARHNGRVIDGLKLIDTGQTRQRRAYWKVVKI